MASTRLDCRQPRSFENASDSGRGMAGSPCTPIELRHGDAAQDAQDAIASQILASLADGDAWKTRFAEKRDVIRRMARQALEEDEKGKTLPLDDLLRCIPGPQASIIPSGRTARNPRARACGVGCRCRGKLRSHLRVNQPNDQASLAAAALAPAQCMPWSGSQPHFSLAQTMQPCAPTGVDVS